MGLAEAGAEDVTMVVACVNPIPRLLPGGWGIEGKVGATVKLCGAT